MLQRLPGNLSFRRLNFPLLIRVVFYLFKNDINIALRESIVNVIGGVNERYQRGLSDRRDGANFPLIPVRRTASRSSRRRDHWNILKLTSQSLWISWREPRKYATHLTASLCFPPSRQRAATTPRTLLSSSIKCLHISPHIISSVWTVVFWPCYQFLSRKFCFH